MGSPLGEDCLNIDEPEVNQSAVQDFVRYGFVAPGEGLFIGHNHSPNSQDNQVLRAHQSLDLAQAERLVLLRLRENLQSLVTDAKVDAFAMSGGMDSRLLFALLHQDHPSFLKTTYIYSRAHRDLAPDRDRDVQIARHLCQDFGYEHHIEVAEISPQVYLTPQDDAFRKPLSGLWGTELLGGSIYHQLLFDHHALLHGDQGSKLLRFLLDRGLQGELELNELYLSHVALLMESSLTAFYRSPTWLYPSASMDVTESPFFDFRLAQILSGLPAHKVSGSHFYSQLMRDHFLDFLKYPINNSEWSGYVREDIEPFGLDSKEQRTYFSDSIKELDSFLLQQLRGGIQKVSGPYRGYLEGVLPQLGLLGPYLFGRRSQSTQIHSQK